MIDWIGQQLPLRVPARAAYLRRNPFSDDKSKVERTLVLSQQAKRDSRRRRTLQRCGAIAIQNIDIWVLVLYNFGRLYEID